MTLSVFTVFTDIPALFWVIMLLSHFIHILMKVEQDAQANKIAIKAWFTSPAKWLSMSLALMQSVTLLVIGYNGYLTYAAKHPDMDMTWYLYIGASLVGFSSSSLWENVMSIAGKAFNKKADE